MFCFGLFGWLVGPAGCSPVKFCRGIHMSEQGTVFIMVHRPGGQQVSEQRSVLIMVHRPDQFRVRGIRVS